MNVQCGWCMMSVLCIWHVMGVVFWCMQVMYMMCTACKPYGWHGMWQQYVHDVYYMCMVCGRDCLTMLFVMQSVACITCDLYLWCIWYVHGTYASHVVNACVTSMWHACLLCSVCHSMLGVWHVTYVVHLCVVYMPWYEVCLVVCGCTWHVYGLCTVTCMVCMVSVMYMTYVVCVWCQSVSHAVYLEILSPQRLGLWLCSAFS